MLNSKMTQRISHNESEYSGLIRVLDFRLPHKFKKIGYSGAVLLLALLVGYKFLGSNAVLAKDVLRTLILFFLLTASLSRDTLEDEFNRYIRFQSYVLSFVCTGAYSIFLPLIALVFDILITEIAGDGVVGFHEMSAFEVIFILMGLQLLFFETLKRFGRA